MKLRSPSRILANLFCRGLYRGLGSTGICLAVAGCSRGPARIEIPGYDPAGSASAAMGLYDKDGDGFIADAELEKAPALKAGIKNLDVNKDSKVDAQEIAGRIAAWEKQKIGLMRFACEVSLDGKPVQGAIVTFEPEEYLADVVKKATGETSILGTTTPVIPTDQMADPTLPPGIQGGFYKVRISKMVNGKELIPAKYNTDTILGQEVATDDWAISNKQVRFTMSSK